MPCVVNILFTCATFLTTIQAGTNERIHFIVVRMRSVQDWMV